MSTGRLKFYLYIDETGQETRGELFIVTVLLVPADNRENFREQLSEMELLSKKSIKNGTKRHRIAVLHLPPSWCDDQAMTARSFFYRLIVSSCAAGVDPLLLRFVSFLNWSSFLYWKPRVLRKPGRQLVWATTSIEQDEVHAFLVGYFQRYARKSHQQGGAKTFVALSQNDGKTILGFFTLSPASVEYSRVPEMLKRWLARYDVPVFRLGRLAVALSQQGRGLGGQLLLSAGRRCLRSAGEVGGVAMLIDAKNERVSDWYASYGAIPLLDTPLSLLLPLATIEAALKSAGQL